MTDTPETPQPPQPTAPEASGISGAAPPASSPPRAAIKPITRRNFLTKAGWGFFWIFIGSWAGSLGRYLFPNILYEPRQTFKAGRPEDYEIGIVNAKWKKSQRVWIIREPNGIYALWARCTHLGCTPGWFSAENRFKCPCHGSNFSKRGDVMAGPAPKPLWRCAIELSPDGELIINKGQLENKPGRREHEPYFISFKV